MSVYRTIGPLVNLASDNGFSQIFFFVCVEDDRKVIFMSKPSS